MATGTPIGAARLRPDKTDAIVAAVFAELAKLGWEAMTMDGVARRAGVGKPALYRRWPSKDEMILDCVVRAATAAALPADTGSLREDLLAFTRQAAQVLGDPLAGRVIAAVLAAMSTRPALAEAMIDSVRQPRRAAAAAALQRAIDRGEIPADSDLDLTTDLLAAPLYMYAVRAAGQVPSDYPERLTDAVLRSVTSRARPVRDRSA